MRRLNAHRGQLVDPKISEHRGRIVKTTGDGLLVEFPSVVNAVRCATEIQRAMVDRNSEMAEDRRIIFRVGINLGDVIVEDDDIFGDGVNIAARLEALAEPGGICISGTVYDRIGDRLPYAFEDMGQQSVKNIARPVRAFAMSATTVAATPRVAVQASTDLDRSRPIRPSGVSAPVSPQSSSAITNTEAKPAPRLSIEDVASFARAFRKVTGLAPGAHRKRFGISALSTADFAQNDPSSPKSRIFEAGIQPG